MPDRQADIQSAARALIDSAAERRVADGAELHRLDAQWDGRGQAPELPVRREVIVDGGAFDALRAALDAQSPVAAALTPAAGLVLCGDCRRVAQPVYGRSPQACCPRCGKVVRVKAPDEAAWQTVAPARDWPYPLELAPLIEGTVSLHPVTENLIVRVRNVGTLPALDVRLVLLADETVIERDIDGELPIDAQCSSEVRLCPGVLRAAVLYSPPGGLSMAGDVVHARALTGTCQRIIACPEPAREEVIFLPGDPLDAQMVMAGLWPEAHVKRTGSRR